MAVVCLVARRWLAIAEMVTRTLRRRPVTLVTLE